MINLPRSSLTRFVEDHILSHLTREYRLSYNHFDIYNKYKEDMEYLLSFKDTNKLMVITLYYTPLENSIRLTSITIGYTIQGDQIASYTLTKKYPQDLMNLVTKIERQMFISNTL